MAKPATHYIVPAQSFLYLDELLKLGFGEDFLKAHALLNRFQGSLTRVEPPPEPEPAEPSPAEPEQTPSPEEPEQATETEAGE